VKLVEDVECIDTCARVKKDEGLSNSPAMFRRSILLLASESKRLLLFCRPVWLRSNETTAWERSLVIDHDDRSLSLHILGVQANQVSDLH
jgi:hypothetical protein